MKLIKLLIRTGLIKIIKSDIQKAAQKEDYTFLEYSYTNGLYHIRLEVVKELVKLKFKDIAPILEIAIYDKIPVISIIAIEALAKQPTTEQLKMIEKRLEFWEKEAKKKAFLRKSKRKPYTHHWNNSRALKLKQETMQNIKSFGEKSAYL